MMRKINSNTTTTLKSGPYLAKFLNPALIVSRFEFLPGMKVAHFGCGTGFFTFSIAQKIGADGRIFALDVLEEKIETVKSQAKNLRLGNVIANQVNLEKKDGSGIENESVDWVVIANMLYENTDKNQIIAEAKRILKPEGQILFIDWKASCSVVGPAMKRRVSKEEMMALAKKNSLEISQEIEVSDYHFGMVLRKKI
jgi:ubiquinone/menaquinone biosynthesis C-methylase UbiE